MKDDALTLLRGVDEKLNRLLAMQQRDTSVRVNAHCEPMLVGEYAKLAKRSPDWVRDQIRAGLIETLPGRPYRITPSEVAKVMGVGGAR